MLMCKQWASGMRATTMYAGLQGQHLTVSRRICGRLPCARRQVTALIAACLLRMRLILEAEDSLIHVVRPLCHKHLCALLRSFLGARHMKGSSNPGVDGRGGLASWAVVLCLIHEAQNALNRIWELLCITAQS